MDKSTKKQILRGVVQATQQVSLLITLSHVVGKNYETAAKAGLVTGITGFILSLMNQGRQS